MLEVLPFNHRPPLKALERTDSWQESLSNKICRFAACSIRRNFIEADQDYIAPPTVWNVLWVPIYLWDAAKLMWSAVKTKDLEAGVESAIRFLSLPVQLAHCCSLLIRFGIFVLLGTATVAASLPITVFGLVVCLIELVAECYRLYRIEKLRGVLQIDDVATLVEEMNPLKYNSRGHYTHSQIHVLAKHKDQLNATLGKEVTHECLVKIFDAETIEERVDLAKDLQMRLLAHKLAYIQTEFFTWDKAGQTAQRSMARRLRPWIVNQLQRNTALQIEALIRGESGSITDAVDTLRCIELQFKKQRVTYLIGIAALLLSATALIFTYLACPPAAFFLALALGYALQSVRIYAAIYLEGPGWNIDMTQLLPQFIRNRYLQWRYNREPIHLQDTAKGVKIHNYEQIQTLPPKAEIPLATLYLDRSSLPEPDPFGHDSAGDPSGD